MSFWFTADTHFWHNTIRTHDNRPWNSVEEMNEGLIENWNRVVSKKDSVYHLGDFAWKGHKSREELKSLISRLNGDIHLIFGNHDSGFVIKNADLFKSAQDVLYFRWNNRRYWLSHYPHISWPSSNYDSWHLFGHQHKLVNDIRERNLKSLEKSTQPFYAIPKRMCMSCNLWNYTPVPIDLIERELSGNYLPEENSNCCVECGLTLEIVRPGKYQCIFCQMCARK